MKFCSIVVCEQQQPSREYSIELVVVQHSIYPYITSGGPPSAPSSADPRFSRAGQGDGATRAPLHAGRPCERLPSNDMHVQVKDRLARTLAVVDHQTVVRQTFGGDDGGHSDGEHVPEDTFMLGVGEFEPRQAVTDLRYQQHVRRRNGCNVAAAEHGQTFRS